MVDNTGPFWHDENPWKDNLVYVTVEELAACHYSMTAPNRSWDVIEVIAHWAQYGDKLDAYILCNSPLFSAGVRYGPQGHDYLFPHLVLPKVKELRDRYLALKYPRRRGEIPVA